MKVLIISHNPISTNNNMGKTLLSLFSEFDREELCQLYIHPATPDIVVCNSYYRITDKEILKSLYSFKSVGKKLRESEVIAEKSSLHTTVMRRNPNNDLPSRRLLRDLMWKISPWYTKKLRTWLEEEQPSCIFLAPGYAKFIYDIALKIADERKLPIISYICDDYYFVKEPKGGLGRMQLCLLKKKTEKLLQNTAHLITISDEIRDKYLQEFMISATTVMTGTNYKIEEDVNVCQNPTVISYFGNMGYNRNISLADIGKTLDKINSEMGTKYKLKVYTNESSTKMLQVFGGVECVELQDFVFGEQFDNALHSAELLLHVEAFDEECIDIVKHSISTKIADSLGSGIPLVAYGPDCVSSMKHLIRNDCALRIHNRNKLEALLHRVFTDEKERIRIAMNGLNAARQYHDCARNSKTIKQIVKRI